MSIYLGENLIAGGLNEELTINNPFSLLDYKYSEYELSNASWLLSNGQWNNGAVYQSVYNLLLQIYNGTVTKAGVSVKLSTETYADTDFVLNTTDTTFRLPIKVLLAGSKRVAGNGMALGITNGSRNGALTGSTNNGATFLSDSTYYGTQIQDSIRTTNGSGGVYGVTLDETKSGIETSANGLYLYFYVGEVVQDANIIAAAGVLTDVADLKNASNFSQTGLSTLSGLGMPSDRYENLTFGASGSMYTAPANGIVTFGVLSTNGGYSALVALTDDADSTWMSHGEMQLYSVQVGLVANQGYCLLLPVKAGRKFGIAYGGNVTQNWQFKFIYAEGEE